METLTQKKGIEFKRESNRNYMVIRPGNTDTGFGAVRMLSENSVPGLLVFREKVFNGEMLFYYDITSKQPLKRILESRDITGEEIRNLLTGLLGVLGEMERFFLDESQLMLDAEMIYVDPDSFTAGWCVIPGRMEDFPESFRKFSQYLLDHINNNDSDAVVLAFGIFRQSRKENFGLEDIEKELQKTLREKPGDEVNEDIAVKDVSSYDRSGTSKPQDHKEPVMPEHAVKDLPDPDIGETDNLQKGNPLYYLLVIPLLLVSPVLVCFRYGFKSIFLLAPMIAISDIVIGAAGILLIRTLLIRPRQGKDKNSSGRSKEKVKKRSESKGEREEREELEIIFKEADKIYEPVDPMGTGSSVPADDDVFRTTLLTAQPVEFSRRRLVSLADGRVIPVPYFPFLIGKNKNICDFCPDDVGVSRLHLKIENEQDEYFVSDLNSTNGTYINGRLLEPDETCAIKPGDEIRIAAGRYRFE